MSAEWYNRTGRSAEISVDRMESDMKNVILIGMPGTGKSVVGRALAERLGAAFVDVDDLIVAQTGKTLPEILRTEGLDAFLRIEEEVGASIAMESTVIATGGSLVLSERAMENLRKTGVVVWLETPLSQISSRMPEDLTDRGIAAPDGRTIYEIYKDREALYARYADLIVASCDGEEDTAKMVETIMRTVGIHL
jgi:shikimate kinase